MKYLIALLAAGLIGSLMTGCATTEEERSSWEDCTTSVSNEFMEKAVGLDEPSYEILQDEIEAQHMCVLEQT